MAIFVTDVAHVTGVAFVEFGGLLDAGHATQAKWLARSHIGGFMTGLSRLLFLSIGLHAAMSSGAAQQMSPLPVIDMHSHGAMMFDEQSVQPIQPWIDIFRAYNVQHAVLSAYPHQLAAWSQESDILIPSLMFPCVQQFVRHCFPGGERLPDLKWLRGELEAGRIAMLGEVVTELFGIFPNDPALEPYFSLAEEFDIPFGLHMGPGPKLGSED